MMLAPTAFFSSAKRFAFIEAACATRSVIFFCRQVTMYERDAAWYALD
jgi:hypothetical protein